MIARFDACSYLGRHMKMTEGQPETAEELLAVMDHYGLHEALVVDPLGAEANPMAGNARLLARTRSQPRLHPAWCGLMTASRELPPPKELVAQMREQGVGALFLYYRQFDIRLDAWEIDDLLAELAAARVPLFLCPNTGRWAGSNNTDWTNVVRICQTFPDLPVIVSESRIYHSQRGCYAALAVCPNLKVNVSSLWLHTRVEFVCKEFGAEHLVWASGLPLCNPGGAEMQLDYANISEPELEQIAGGTMRKLLAWNENITCVGDQVTFPPADDPLHEAARERKPFRQEHFFDCHGHIGRCSPNHVIEDRPADLVREMDKFGVDVCCVFSLEGVMGDETYGNDLVIEAVQQHPDRFIGFTLVNPHRGERLMRQELDRGAAAGLRGVKLICDYHGYPSEGPNVDIACQYADEHKLLILNHNWGSASQMERLCRTYPNATFITGHMTLAFGEVAKAHENLYICTCPCVDWNYPERAVYGADRLLFGSDLTDLPIGWGLGQIAFAHITEAEKRLILGGNLRRLFDEHGYTYRECADRG